MLERVFQGRRLLYFVGGVTLAAFALGAFTLALLLGQAPFIEPTPQNVVISLNAVLALLAILALLLAYQVFDLFRKRRSGGGARLHGRAALLFGLVATAPSIMLVIFSVAFLHVGMQEWFGDKVEAAVGRSLSITRAYLREHRLGLIRDTYALGSLLEQPEPRDRVAARSFDDVLEAMAERRGIAEILVSNTQGKILAKAGDIAELSTALVPEWAVQAAVSGGSAVVLRSEGERQRALLWLKESERFLIVGRAIDPGISRHVEGVTRAVGAYKTAIDESTTIEARLSVLYLLFALTFVLAAMWAGLMFAGALANPISNLIETADRVRAGDLSARTAVRGRSDEIGNLMVGFNRMTAQLERQQEALLEANAEMDERRRFIAAVLGGVTSGVIGVDDHGVIRAANRYAEDALGEAPGGLLGKSLEEASPELFAAIDASGQVETEIRLIRRGRQRVLLARAASGADLEMAGQVVTFTDITDLVAAKRQAAWSGVARRIAHEIKNPLTPIQLAAERLKRKYLKDVETDPDVFALCCDTIIRQVAALRGMVDEFSDFARLPTPVMQSADLKTICEEVAFLVDLEHPRVRFHLDLGEGYEIDCDPGQVTRALTNVLINAAHAVEARIDRGEDAGSVHLRIQPMEGVLAVIVEDDGDGFPVELLANVTEPYVTTKKDGSGLGLAIVQRILEEHGGALLVQNRAEGGAAVELQFPSRGALAAQDHVQESVEA